MFRVAIVLFLVAVVGERAPACLRETKDEIQRRYGQSENAPQSPSGDESVEYRYKDFIVIVTFVAGKSEQEIFFHRDLKTPLSEGEIQSLLALNSFGQQWERSPELPVWSLGGSDPRNWVALAAYYPQSAQHAAPALGIMTTDYARKHGFM